MAIINKPSDYFNTKLYTGNGASSHAITGVGFKPDWTWNKNRSSAVNHALTDVVRGAPLRLVSNNNEAEINQTTGLLSFNSDGFTVGSDSGYNGNGNSMVSWNWKAGTSFSNSAGANSATIASTGSVNTDAGFSIVSYTGNGSAGATIFHGLGATPAMIIQKIRSSTGNWLVYHHKNTSAPETEFLRLNTANATADEATIWNDTAPTSSVFSVGTESTINGSGNTCVAYCFAEKQGYSKFGSYVGNGNAKGPMIFTGFKPAWIMIKNAGSSSEEWNIWDNKRNTFNVMTTRLVANVNAADSVTSAGFFDFTSNGFKIRSTANGVNQSGNTMIYMAFAENPFVAGNFNPATAR